MNVHTIIEMLCRKQVGGIYTIKEAQSGKQTEGIHTQTSGKNPHNPEVVWEGVAYT